MPERDAWPQQDGDYQADLHSVPVNQKRDRAQEIDSRIDGLLYDAVNQRSRAAGHDLLRFILDEDIREFGQNVDAAESFEAAIRTAAAARGMPPDVGSGVTDIVCTVSLCRFVAEPRGTFNLIRQTPEWHVMEQEGPVPGLRSILGPAHGRVAFGTRAGGGTTQVYYYRPGIERHRELLEAVAASLDEQ